MCQLLLQFLIIVGFVLSVCSNTECAETWQNYSQLWQSPNIPGKQISMKSGRFLVRNICDFIFWMNRGKLGMLYFNSKWKITDFVQEHVMVMKWNRLWKPTVSEVPSKTCQKWFISGAGPALGQCNGLIPSYPPQTPFSVTVFNPRWSQSPYLESLQSHCFKSCP